MKLNNECVRDVLLYLEENLYYVNVSDNTLRHAALSMNAIATELHGKKSYEVLQVKYTVEKLIEAGFIHTSVFAKGHQNAILQCEIDDITWSGHQFLSTIRSNTIWNAVKQKATQIGGMSIQGLNMIASSIIQGIASNPDFIQEIIKDING